MNRWLLRASLVAICCLGSSGPALAQPIFTHTRTVEYVANNSFLVMLARVVEVESIEGDTASCVAEFTVDEVLKGMHEARRKLTVPTPIRVVQQWKDESRQVLVAMQDGDEAFVAIDLGSDELAEMTSDLTLLTKPEEVIRCYREAIRRSPGVTRTLSAGFPIAPQIRASVKKWREYHGVQATVPVDETLERMARKYVLSEDYMQRCEGTRALQHFRSQENIARAKELLSDPATSIVWHAEQNKRVEVRVYGVRTAAYETLKYWGIEVEKPVLREEIRQDTEKKEVEPKADDRDATDAKPTPTTPANDDHTTAESEDKPAKAEKVYRGAASIRDGNHYADAVHVDVSDEEYPSKVLDMFLVMPKVETIVVAGPRYTDRHLEMLARSKTLRVLVLDSTDITDEAIERLRRTRPELKVFRSQRWASAKLGALATEMAGESRKVAEFDSPEVRRLRALIGDKHFFEATSIDFGRLPDDENGPGDEIQNEELLPIKYLTTATKVDLSYSRLNDAGMHYLKGLTKVTELSLPLDEVTAEGMAQLRGMTEVESFRGRLTDEKMATIAGFRKLKHLASGGTGLSDAGLRHLAELKELKLLWLSGTNIRGPGLAHLADKPGLESLTLKESKLEDLSALPALPGLKSLHLETTRVNDASLAHLAKCAALETVWLRDTPITDAGVVHLAKLKNLNDVNLHGTKITDAALAELKQMQGLEYLNLSGTLITNAGLRMLRDFPNLKGLMLYHVELDAEGIALLKSLHGVEVIASPGLLEP